MSGKKRLTHLDVDEVSLVDQPAIGETFIVTKSVNGKGKSVTKKAGEEEDKTKSEGANAETGLTKAEATALVNELVKAAVAEAVKAATPSSSSEDVKKAVDAALVSVRKDMTDVQEMLTQSLALHEEAAMALNSVYALTLSALDMVMTMADEMTADDAGAGTGGGDTNTAMVKQAELVSGIRTSVKAVFAEITKAGAKISRERMTTLREIAEKLTALISSVEAVEAEKSKDGNKGERRTKFLRVTKAVKASLDSATTETKKSVDDLSSKLTALEKSTKEGLEGVSKKLDEVANAAGASGEIGDEDSGEGETGNKKKSVFAGLIPTEQIEKAQRERKEFLGRGKKANAG